MNNFQSILDNGLFLNSSGTTGRPKTLFQPPKKLKAANQVAREVQKIDTRSKILTVCTLRHAGGLLAQTLPAFEIGAEKIEVIPFNAYSWVLNIKDYTHSHLTPDMARAIMKTKSFKNLNLEGKIVTCGSDRVHSSIIQSFIDRGCTFIVNWGMTECGPIAINKTFVPDMEVDVSETLMGNMKYCDTLISNGELFIKGDITIFDGSDWWGTGDMVKEDDDHFYFLGRKEYGRK
tara:strand:- start:510 stop:1208 length:699 start_codon:yes stop_codon:yes gene_type:complete